MKSKPKKILDATIYLYENHCSLTEAAKIFGTDRHCLPLEDYQNYTVIKDDKCYWFTEEELQIVDYWVNNPSITFTELKRKFGKPGKADTLKKWLEVLGYPTDRHYQIQYNRNAFNEIKTEEDAYWLGFILADGYINEERNLLQIKLAEKDHDHLVKFLKYMQYEDIENNIKSDVGGAYTKDNICHVVKVNGEQLVNNLKQYGLFQAKSGKEIPYKCSTVDLEKAYIRGIIDGDGYLRTTQDGFGIVGSYEVLEYIKNFINENVTDMNNISINEHGMIYKLATSGINKTSTIMNYFYKDAKIYLDRKYSIFEEKYN